MQTVNGDGGVVLETMLVDGRNRRACKLAGFRPEVRHLNGADPTAYVFSANIHRRHMTTGQRAMAVAVIYPEPEKAGRGQKGAGSGDLEFCNFAHAAHRRLSPAWALPGHAARPRRQRERRLPEA